MDKEVFYNFCNFLNIMVSGDRVVKKILPVGVAREQAVTRKFSTIFECSGNFQNIMINGDPIVE